MTSELVLDGIASERPVPPTARATEAVSTVVTRLSFVVVAWLLLTQTPTWSMAAVMLSVQALGYLAGASGGAWLLDRIDADRLAVGAELVSALALAGVAFEYAQPAVLPGLLVVLGAARAAGELSQSVRAGSATASNPDEATRPRRAILVGAGTLAVGALAGAAAALLGPVGALWLVAMACAGCAAAVVRGEPTPATLVPIELPAGDAPPPAPVRLDPLLRRLGLVLFTTGLLVSAGVVILGSVWTREEFTGGLDQPGRGVLGLGGAEGIGLVGGALVVGAVGAAAVVTAASRRPDRFLLFGLGYFVGGGALALLAGGSVVSMLFAVTGVVVGVALASVTPVMGLVLSEQVPAAQRGRVGALVLATGAVGAAAGAWLGAWLAVGAPVAVAVGTAAGAVLVAMLIPVTAHRTWQRTVPAGEMPVTLLPRNGWRNGRLAVTLAYIEGEWLVEVRQGRAVLSSRHVVRPADALSMLAMLNVPALSHSVGSVLATDQAEASRQLDRVRLELAELEAKLTGLKSMTVLAEERSDH
ncbi:MAG: hypothetical protein ACM30G_21535 [Micromonosporaceae bacterium]